MTAIARTPLTDLPPVAGSHALTEQPLNGKLNLRGNPQDADFLSAVATADLTLPVQANTVTRRASVTASWLGPDEWLITTPLDQVANLAARLRNALDQAHFALTEVSDYSTTLQLRGPLARQVLATAVPLDLRAHAFAPGQCAQTRLGHASILLWAIDHAPTYDIQIRWSFARYVFDLLARGIADCEAIQASANR